MKTIKTFKNDGTFANKLIFLQINNVMGKMLKKIKLLNNDDYFILISISLTNGIIRVEFEKSETREINFESFTDKEKKDLKMQLNLIGGNYLKLKFEENNNLINYIEICQENQN